MPRTLAPNRKNLRSTAATWPLRVTRGQSHHKGVVTSEPPAAHLAHDRVQRDPYVACEQNKATTGSSHLLAASFPFTLDAPTPTHGHGLCSGRLQNMVMHSVSMPGFTDLARGLTHLYAALHLALYAAYEPG